MRSLLPALLALSFSVQAHALSPPTNDNCSGAIVLTVGSTCNPVSGGVFGATQSLDAIVCNGYQGDADDDIWFRFVAGNTTQTIQVTGSADYDAVIDLRTGGCSGTNIACADATTAGGTEEIVANGLTVGAWYYIRVYDYGTGAPSTNTLSICVTGPASGVVNDECSGAITLATGSTCNAITGTVVGATASLPAIVCNTYQGTADDDVWYRFTATASTHTITVAGSAQFDAVVDLRSGGCNGTPIACADSYVAGGTEQLVANGLFIGSTYYVRVYDYGTGQPATPTFTICVTGGSSGVAPANDDCAGAIILTMGSSCAPVNGTLAGATETVPANSCGGHDVWYRFVATAVNGSVELHCSSGLDGAVKVWTGDCGSLSNDFLCFYEQPAGVTEYVELTDLVIGGVYTVQVSNYQPGDPATSDFSICVYATPAPPPNDDCTGATHLPMGAACSYTVGTGAGATYSPGASNCNQIYQAESDEVWYAVTATSEALRITVDGDGNSTSGYDPAVELLFGACGSNYHLVDCVNETGPGGSEQIDLTLGVNVGDQFLVRVYSAQPYPTAPFTFRICAQDLTISTGIAPAHRAENDWSVVTGPSEGTAMLRYEGADADRGNWQLLDVAGRPVRGGAVTLAPSSGNVQVNGLTPGAYIWTVVTAQGRVVKRFVVR